MDRQQARRRLDEYADRERRIQRRFIAPTMIYFAVFGFAFLVTGGFGTWWGTLVLLSVFMGWIVYSRRLTGVAWTRAQNLKLWATVLLGFAWILACNAYFVNWNPIDLPLAGLMGGILAAAPFLVLARTYRP